MDDPKPSLPPLIDSHAHVWDQSCQMVPGARHHPAYQATIDTYLKVLDTHGIEKAVLVQPSFLGTDNTYLLACLRAHPDRLRGIVVLDSRVQDAELADQNGLGVVGHRLNLIGRDPSLIQAPAFRALILRTTGLGWWTEVQAKGHDWPDIARQLARQGARIMVDHFGLPSRLTCPGIETLEALDPSRISLKLSAPYRQQAPDYAHAVLRLIDRTPPVGLLWGSDWPWTQHEGQHEYVDTIRWLTEWTTDTHRADMAVAAPNLLGF